MDDVVVTVAHGQVKRRRVAGAASVDVGAVGDEETGRVDVALTYGDVQRRIAGLDAAGTVRRLGIGTRRQQDAQAGHGVVHDGVMQRRLT